MNPNFNTNTAVIRKESNPQLQYQSSNWMMVHSEDSLSLDHIRSAYITLEHCSCDKKGRHLPFYHSRPKHGVTFLDYEIVQHILLVPDFFLSMIEGCGIKEDEITILCVGTTIVRDDKQDIGMFFLSYKKGSPEVQIGILPKFRHSRLKNVYRLVYRYAA